MLTSDLILNAILFNAFQEKVICLWPSANKDLIYWGQHITYCIEQTYADITEKKYFFLNNKLNFNFPENFRLIGLSVQKLQTTEDSKKT